MSFISTALFRPVATVFLMVLICFVALPATPAVVSDSKDRSVIGDWKLTAALDFADIASLDEHEAKQFVGKTLAVRREKLTLGDRECGSPGFETERVEPTLYLREHYRADSAGLHLPNPVSIVHLDCTSVFVKDKNRLVVFWKGWFFEAVRVNRQHTAP